MKKAKKSRKSSRLTQPYKRVVVTGGAGFIGSHTIDALLADPKVVRVICIDNFDASLYDPRLKEENIAPHRKNPRFVLYRADIRNAKKMRSIFKKEKPDAIIHLAAKADTRNAVEEPHEYLETNIYGTLNILECARECGVKKIIFASSSSVYGNKNEAPFSEDVRADFPLSPYGATKRAGEILAHTYYHNFQIPIVCVRIFNAYGERMRPTLVLAKWTEKVLNGEEIEMSGKGTRARDYTYIRDLVESFLLALGASAAFEVINVGNTNPVTLTALLQTLEQVSGLEARVRTVPSHAASVELTHASIDRARRVIGWTPKTSFEEGVRRYVLWVRNSRKDRPKSR